MEGKRPDAGTACGAAKSITESTYIGSRLCSGEQFFTHIVHEDIDAIIADIRDTHKKDSATAENQTTAAKLKQAIEEAMQFEGSDQGKQMCIYCSMLDIPYDDMPPEEFSTVLRWLRRS